MTGLFDALNIEYEPAKPLVSDQDVREIRRLYVPGRVRQVDLAEEYGISQGEISRIINRKRRGRVE